MNMTQFYKKSVQETLEELGVTDQGLTNEKVKKRRQQYGFNELEEAKKKSTVQVFFEQFKDFLVIILLVAALISAFIGEFESSIVILVVLILNAILGTIQHVKAEQSLNSLKALSSPSAKVLRDGKKIEIPSREVVVGDILFLEAGDYVSADGRVLESASLQINESSLTGESESVNKTIEAIPEEVGIGDRTNMAFSGSFVTYGRGTIVVTDIGMQTEIGKIANLLGSAKEKKTPLQVSLDNFGKKLAIIVILIAIIIFALDMFRGRELVDSFMFAVSLAVAAIPEALSSIVTIVLAFGTQKLAKENAIIRKLHSVESLGSVSVICSDKTGTLTQNKMTIQKLYVDNKIIDKNNWDADNDFGKKFVTMSILCNDAITEDGKEIGDPTELAMVNLAEKIGLDDELDLRKQYPRLAEVPFDSDRKLMSTVHKINDETRMITKGAPDVLLSRVVKMATSNGIRDLTDEDRHKILQANLEFSKDGLRVLALGYKILPDHHNVSTDDESDLIFVGLLAMMDPPRPESKEAVEKAKAAGITPVMITGDHKVTASAIAKQIGILSEGGEAVEGAEVEQMSDEELRRRVKNISVYARVSPEHKIRIVRAWQDTGHLVAMTGDGVNDAPALKQSDIGIAMGITGTEVAKDAASMVLTDDNFSTIVKAISNGRSIYANIKNAIKFLLSGNTAAIIAVLFASLGGFPVPFAPVQLLFINLLTDSLPAIGIGLEPMDESLMKQKPRNINEPLLNKKFMAQVVIGGVIISISVIAAFLIGLQVDDGGLTAMTMAFTTLCFSRLLHSFNCRTNRSIIKTGIFKNKFVWGAVFIGVLLLAFVVFTPGVRRVFEVVPLETTYYWTIFGLSLFPLISIQIYKLIIER
jgi:P-type Ca2+ transporter type 2C